jgi:hypothetical protein
MATTTPQPLITPLYLRQLELTIILNLYRALHGGDPFNGSAIPSEALALGLVSYLDEQKIGTPNSIVENLAKMNIKVAVKYDGKSTDVKTTKEYLDRMAQIGPQPTRLVTHCINVSGIGEFCWTSRLLVAESNRA